MEGTLQAIDFQLARDLGKSLGEIRALPNLEVVQWQAFYHVRDEMRKLNHG